MQRHGFTNNPRSRTWRRVGISRSADRTTVAVDCISVTSLAIVHDLSISNDLSQSGATSGDLAPPRAPLTHQFAQHCRLSRRAFSHVHAYYNATACPPPHSVVRGGTFCVFVGVHSVCGHRLCLVCGHTFCCFAATHSLAWWRRRRIDRRGHLTHHPPRQALGLCLLVLFSMAQPSDRRASTKRPHRARLSPFWGRGGRAGGME